MRKARFWVVMILLLVLIAHAVCIEYIDRVLCLLAAAALVCVWVHAEAMVDRAQAPLVIRDEKPPED